MSGEGPIERGIATIESVREHLGRAVVGQTRVVEEVLVSLLCGGHVLLEGAPGLGKTLLITSLGETLDLVTRRVQFTPDLMPADILGTRVLVEDESGAREVRFQPGPVFANLLLADEINRGTPKTQSALLEAMQEYGVTSAGERHQLDLPFVVLATQNPIEMEGTYPLPEAQLDRFFFKIIVPHPSRAELEEIVTRTTGTTVAKVGRVTDRDGLLEIQSLVREMPIGPAVSSYAVRLVEATHPGSRDADWQRLIRYGASPRGAQSLVLAAKAFALLAGRANVGFDDVARAALPALRHRIILSFQGEAEGHGTDEIIERILEEVSTEPHGNSA